MSARTSYPPRDGEGDRAKCGGGGSTQLQRPIVYTARKLRREMSPPERKLWQYLRQRPGGLKFRKQHPFDPYVVDFHCREAALVIEVDGWAHETLEIARRDGGRDAFLRDRGLQIMRIPAAEIMRDVAAATLGILERAGSPLHQPPAGPPPRSGEE
jgi:very-short-patch-repair endonuclease